MSPSPISDEYSENGIKAPLPSKTGLPPWTGMTLSTRDFQSIRDVVYKKLGIYFEDAKVFFIQKRIEKRMAALGIDRFDDYAFQLCFTDSDGAEMQRLANLITTNETYMFREFDQLQAFADFCLPEILKAKEKNNDRCLKIWSAGCSSGEEPYTLAIILREIMHDAAHWDIRITGTDIDERIIEMAKNAVYEERSIRDVPVEYMGRHLKPMPNGNFKIHSETSRLVDIQHLNLHDKAAMRKMRYFDFIFCRNVLIYFDDISRRSAVDHFYNALNPGGYIFLGHSESIGRITSAFTLIRKGKHLVYQKDAQPGAAAFKKQVI